MSIYNPLEGNKPTLNIKINEFHEDQVSIIIVHRNAPDYLSICLQTITVTSSNSNYEIIVVDNNSTIKEAKEFLDIIEKNDIKVVRNEKNLHWSEAANRGAAAASKTSQYLVFMHCDVNIINKHWLDILINASESKKSGMIGTEVKSFNIEGKKVDFLAEWLLIFTRECWEACGPFPEKLPIIGSSFIVTARASKKGFNPQATTTPIAAHFEMFSFDISEFERITTLAVSTIGKLLHDVQTEHLRSVNTLN